MNKKIHIILFMLLILSIPYLSMAQTVIINKNNDISSISKGKIRNIFLGNSNVWENGKLIRLADYNSENSLRGSFSSEFLGLSPRKVSMIWIKVSLSGKSFPPKILRDESQIIDFVANNEFAIAYVSDKTSLPPSVKKLKVE